MAFLVLAGGMSALAQTPAPAGQSIISRASATYQSNGAGGADTISNLISVVVAPVSGLSVTPDDTAVSGVVAADLVIIRTFTLSNLSNRDDQLRIVSADVTSPAALLDLHFDVDGDGAVGPGDSPIVVGVTSSPVLPSTASVDVLLRYSAVGAPEGTVITSTLNVETLEPGSVNGPVQDSGTRIDRVGPHALFTDPDDPGQPPPKLVDGEPRINASAGQEVTFQIDFANSGTAPGIDTVIIDPLPAEVSFVSGSLLLDGLPLSDAADGDAGEVVGNTVTVRLASVALGSVHQLRLRARINNNVTAGTLVQNVATLSAVGSPPVSTRPALMLVRPFGVFFDAGSGSAVPGVQAQLLMGPPPAALASLPATTGDGALPNLTNANPFRADPLGRYSFLLGDGQIGSPGLPATYYLHATHERYAERVVQIEVEPGSGGVTGAPVYLLTLTSQDGLPLIDPATGSLVPGPVTLPDVAALGFDVPLFPDKALGIIKTADKSHAYVGESVGYTIRVTNQGATDITGLQVRDLLPRFLDPAEGTFAILSDGRYRDLDPAQDGRALTFALGDLAAGDHVEVTYRARIAPGAPADALQNSALATGTLATGEPTSAGPARAVVLVRQGIFSFQQVLMGRVFHDQDGDGRFGDGDLPLSGVRVVLDNGMTSTSDSLGLYSIPSVPENARAVGLDATTYPPGYCPEASEHLADAGESRLLRTPLGGGALLTQSFLLAPGPECPGTPELPAEPDAVADQEDAEPAALPAGTYVAVQTEELPPVERGAVVILQPNEGYLARAGALDLTVRTHLEGAVDVRVNGVQVGSDRIGETILDQRNALATFRFVGIPLRPGPNSVIVHAVDSHGQSGSAQERTVYARGTAETLLLRVGEDTLVADGNARIGVEAELLDAWGHRAQDARLYISTSAGTLARNTEEAGARELAVSTEWGVAKLQLVAGLTTGDVTLHATNGDLSAETHLQLMPGQRPRLLVGLAELTVGAAERDSGLGEDPATVESGARGRLAFYFKGPAPKGTLLTAAYDSDRRLNRTGDADRLFELDPLEELYPVMGDSSARFQDAQSNSRAYVKLERNRSHLLWGDLDPHAPETQFAADSRKLTGLQWNLEQADGDGLTLSAAEPDHAFAREVLSGAGIAGLYRLAHAPLVPGSETITLEVHDRRNPEVILHREPLVRGTDYNIDVLAGTILFKRPIDQFTDDFDLVEIVVLYEFEPGDFESTTWNGRARQSWADGRTRLGMSLLGEDQDGGDDFHLAGMDLSQQLPGGGELVLEVAASDGRPRNLGTASTGTSPEDDGMAFRAEYTQSFAALRGPLSASYQEVDAGFLNPFGGSVIPGNRRMKLGWEPALTNRVRLQVSLQDEENETNTVDNTRTTASLGATADLRDNLKVSGSFEHRDFEDHISEEQRTSDLLSADFSWQPSKRWQLSLRREQNVSGDADPSFPDSTFLNVGFQQNPDLRYFLKVRDSASAIETLADVSAAGIMPPRSQREIRIGVESRLGSYSTLSTRYQLENGIHGNAGFAVVGLGTRLPVNDTLSLDFQGEAGLDVEGPGDSFASLSTGLAWLPREGFRGTLRYELRDAAGFGQTLSAAAVGKPADDLTLLAQLTVSDASQSGQDTTKVNLLAGLALRPLDRDDFGLLFSWRHRDQKQRGNGPGDDVRSLTDTISADGVLEITPRLSWFGRAALSYNKDRPAGRASLSTTTSLLQSRLMQRLGRRWDVAGEVRTVYLWEDSLSRNHLGIEAGFWVHPDLRVALGYGFTRSDPLEGAESATGSGIYVTVSTKLNRILKLLEGKP